MNDSDFMGLNNLSYSDHTINAFIHLEHIYGVYAVFEFFYIFGFFGDFSECAETVTRMMASSSALLYCFFSCLFNHRRNLFTRQHADICANSQIIHHRHSITVKSSAIKQDKISSFSVYFSIIAQRFFIFFLLRNFIPVSFVLR